jgi:acyl carrier protein
MNSRDLIASIVRKDTLVCEDNTLLGEVSGWDSLKGVRLVLRLEEITRRELSESEIEGLQCVGDVDRILSSVR